MTRRGFLKRFSIATAAAPIVTTIAIESPPLVIDDSILEAMAIALGKRAAESVDVKMLKWYREEEYKFAYLGGLAIPNDPTQ